MPAKKEETRTTRAANAVSPQGENVFESMRVAGKASFEFLRNSWKVYGAYILKANVLVVAITIGLLVLLGIAAFLALGSTLLAGEKLTPALTTPLVLLGGLLLAVIIISNLAQYVLLAVQYVGTRDGMEGKPLPRIRDSVREQLVPATKYALVLGVIFLAFSMAPLVALALPGPGSIFVMLALFLIAMIILIPVIFAIQFSFWELIVNGRGVFESLRVSLALVRNNLVKVIVFDIAVMLILFAVNAVFYIAWYIVELVLLALVIAVLPLGIVATVLALLILGLAQTMLTNLLTLPVTYAFWKSLNSESKR